MGRRPLPRRALLAATLGALYGLLLLPAPQTLLGISGMGVAWFVLSAALLFLHVAAYHAFTTWGFVWIVLRGFEHARREGPVDVAGIGLDVLLPLAAVLLLMSSPYLAWAKAAREGAASKVTT